MERAYNFIKITLLGVIVGVLVVLILQIDFWGNHIQKILRKSVQYQNNEIKNEEIEKNAEKLPQIETLPRPKFKI